MVKTTPPSENICNLPMRKGGNIYCAEKRRRDIGLSAQPLRSSKALMRNRPWEKGEKLLSCAKVAGKNHGQLQH